MIDTDALGLRLLEVEATIKALLSGEIDPVVDPRNNTPVLLSLAQVALREREERYRRIVETTNDGIWTIGLDSIITFANQGIADMLGCAPGDLVGHSVLEFLPAALHQRASLRIRRAGAGSSEEGEVSNIRNDGSTLWVMLKTSPMDNAVAFSSSTMIQWL